MAAGRSIASGLHRIGSAVQAELTLDKQTAALGRTDASAEQVDSRQSPAAQADDPAAGHAGNR